MPFPRGGGARIRKNHQAKVTSPAADLHERQRRFGWSPLIVVALADGVLS